MSGQRERGKILIFDRGNFIGFYSRRRGGLMDEQITTGDGLGVAELVATHVE